MIVILSKHKKPFFSASERARTVLKVFGHHLAKILSFDQNFWTFSKISKLSTIFSNIQTGVLDIFVNQFCKNFWYFSGLSKGKPCQSERLTQKSTGNFGPKFLVLTVHFHKNTPIIETVNQRQCHSILNLTFS